MGQLTFNCQDEVVQDLSTRRSARAKKCATGLIAIDYQCTNQLHGVFISAGPVTIVVYCY